MKCVQSCCPLFQPSLFPWCLLQHGDEATSVSRQIQIKTNDDIVCWHYDNDEGPKQTAPCSHLEHGTWCAGRPSINPTPMPNNRPVQLQLAAAAATAVNCNCNCDWHLRHWHWHWHPTGHEWMMKQRQRRYVCCVFYCSFVRLLLYQLQNSILCPYWI